MFEIVFGIIMCLVVYLTIGVVLCCGMDRYHEPALICACICFWPIILIVMGIKGLKKMFREGD